MFYKYVAQDSHYDLQGETVQAPARQYTALSQIERSRCCFISAYLEACWGPVVMDKEK